MADKLNYETLIIFFNQLMVFIKGQTPWIKGKHHSNETKKKMSLATIGKPHPWAQGSKSYMWKGGISKNKEYVSWSKHKRNRMPKIGGHTWGEWETLKVQYNFTCPCCHKKVPEIKLTQDHIIPLSKGGSDNIENIQPLCSRCNSKKHTKIINYKQIKP